MTIVSLIHSFSIFHFGCYCMLAMVIHWSCLSIPACRFILKFSRLSFTYVYKMWANCIMVMSTRQKGLLQHHILVLIQLLRKNWAAMNTSCATHRVHNKAYWPYIYLACSTMFTAAIERHMCDRYVVNYEFTKVDIGQVIKWNHRHWVPGVLLKYKVTKLSRG